MSTPPPPATCQRPSRLRPSRLGGRWTLALPLLYMALVTFLSHQPNDPEVETVFGFSLAVLNPKLGNLLHVPLYWVLGTLWCLYLAGRGLRPLPRAVLVTLLCAGFGVLDEFHQSFVPGRMPSGLDVMLDTLGGALAVWTWPPLARLCGIAPGTPRPAAP